MIEDTSDTAADTSSTDDDGAEPRPPTARDLKCATCEWLGAIQGGFCCQYDPQMVSTSPEDGRCHHHTILEPPIFMVPEVDPPFENIHEPCPACAGRGKIRHAIGKTGTCKECGGSGYAKS